MNDSEKTMPSSDEERKKRLERMRRYQRDNKVAIAARKKAKYIPRPCAPRTPFDRKAWFAVYNVSYRAKNLEQLKAKGVAYRLANREKRKAAGAARYALNREAKKAHARAFRAANKDKCAEVGARCYRKNRAKRLARQKAYNKEHPEIGLNKAQVRKARALGRGLGNQRVIKAWVASCRKKRRVRCYWCRGMFSPKKCHSDHINPMGVDGRHSIENLCISCGSCNMKKHDKTPEKWNAKLSQPVLL